MRRQVLQFQSSNREYLYSLFKRQQNYVLEDVDQFSFLDTFLQLLPLSGFFHFQMWLKTKQHTYSSFERLVCWYIFSYNTNKTQGTAKIG